MESKWRQDFPLIQHKPELSFLDNGASSQKLGAVIDAVSHVCERGYANIHRGIYRLSQEITDQYELARERVRAFLNAEHVAEIVFTKGTTESLNLLAYSLGEQLEAGDEIILSQMEHHANIVPWQMIAEQKQLVIKVIDVTDEGLLDLVHFESLLSNRTKIVSLAHVSNVLGTVNPIKEIARKAHRVGALMIIDGAQGAPHMLTDVQALACDFYVFSGHKAYAPTGVGVLYGKKALLDQMTPYQTGGGMIHQVSFEKTTFARVPAKFEAGTPPVVQAIGLGVAVDYLRRCMPAVEAYELELVAFLRAQLEAVEGVRVLGPSTVGAVSFVMDGVHPHDIGTILDSENVAVRAGHHCAMPLHERFNVPATVRASIGVYNNAQDVAQLIQGLTKVQDIFLRW